MAAEGVDSRLAEGQLFGCSSNHKQSTELDSGGRVWRVEKLTIKVRGRVCGNVQTPIIMWPPLPW